MSNSSIAHVLLDAGIFDYAIPPHLQVQVGMRVKVPLRKQITSGLILALKAESSISGIKPIQEVIGTDPLLPPDLFELGHWMAKYYATSLSKVFKTFLPPSVRKELVKPKFQQWVRPLVSINQLTEKCQELRRSHPSQAKVLDALLASPKGLFLSALKEASAVSMSPIETLAKQKLIELVQVSVDRSIVLDQDFFPTKPKNLSDEQRTSLEKIEESLTAGRFQTHLLHGVTGSGKTEVYLQAITSTLQKGRSVLFLVPEIALTSQTIERLKGRFQDKIALLHHRLSQGERYDSWQQIRAGKVPIVVGARSALFSPLPNLGLLIVDEEHEPSYKQSDESPKYHARDVAVMRGKLANATVVLGSATPSMESYTNALQGKYLLSTLKNRADAATLPKVILVDMQREKEKAKGFTLFSEPLIEGIKNRLKCGEQTLLFLNRRGYQTSATCSACAHTLRCPDCDISLTYHLSHAILACHLCDYKQPLPRTCPNCHGEDTLKYKGAGTEMVERALHALLPEVRTLRLDADTTRHKGSHQQILRQFRAGKADVLIGTQMIAKGLHLPLVTLVGVIGIDSSLSIPDFRASESVFQLLTQVAGRAGRGQLPGEVLIQTQLSDHPTIKLAAAQDFIAFYKEEIQVRQLFDYPPFTHLIKLTFASKEEARCRTSAEEMRNALIKSFPPSVEINPLIPCGHAKIKGLFRFQCLIKSKHILPVLEYLPLAGTHRHFRLSIDVDPISTYF